MTALSTYNGPFSVNQMVNCVIEANDAQFKIKLSNNLFNLSLLADAVAAIAIIILNSNPYTWAVPLLAIGVFVVIKANLQGEFQKMKEMTIRAHMMLFDIDTGKPGMFNWKVTAYNSNDEKGVYEISRGTRDSEFTIKWLSR